MQKTILAVMLLVAAALCAPMLVAQPQPPKPGPPAYAQVVKDLDASIRRGIDYLEKSIHKDGHYGVMAPVEGGVEKYVDDVGITGIAVLSILQSPYAGEEKGKDYFKKAVEYILKNVHKDGSIVNEDGGNSTYKTAICIQVLTLLDKDKYADTIKKGQEFLRGRQFDEDDKLTKENDYFYGGWGYGGQLERATIPPTEFVIEGLRQSGLDPNDPIFKKAVEFMANCQNNTATNKYDQKHPEIIPINDGGVRHSPVTSKVEVEAPAGKLNLPSYGSMTAAFIKSLLYAGVPKSDERLTAAFRWLLKNYTFDRNPGFTEKDNKDKQGLYYYYHIISKAFFLYGIHVIETPDGKMHNWALELSRKITSLQREDGSWFNQHEARWLEGNPSLVTGYCIMALSNCREEFAAQKAAVDGADKELSDLSGSLVDVAMKLAQKEITKEEADKLIEQIGEKIVVLTQSLNNLKATIRFEEK